MRRLEDLNRLAHPVGAELDKDPNALLFTKLLSGQCGVNLL